ncbi:hypothetical protein EGH22_14960 [Halomicroarcula sp. F28]|uniref:hypothetical protein n=1 Tax=Haloarcula salinisoli TaxID=2487746 RepID=UPI001C72C0CB|nr:hypothetical protein [Halomicroarcula salinisoli]MBX0287632.1 hypothetical protein [Halomicroarcula salinisoli]
MVGELDALRAEGSTRVVAELLVVAVVSLALSFVVFVPALRAVAPELFAGAIEYGKYTSNVPDSPVELAHLGFNVVTVGGFLYWRLNHTALGQRYRESFEQQR